MNFLKKTLRKISLHKFSLIAFIILIFLQAILYTGIILLSSVPAQLNKINFQIMENTVNSKGPALEKSISSFVNMADFYSSVNDLISQKAFQSNMTIAEYMKSHENRQNILYDSTIYLVNALRNGEIATGCFIILENDGSSPDKDSVYLRDINPSDTPDSRSDIFVEAGPNHLIYNYGFSLDSFWTQHLNTENNCTFYNTVYYLGNNYPDIDATDLGYFSMPTRIHENDIQCITYSVPLLDEKHHSYGIIGFEVSIDYLTKLLPNQDFTIDQYGSYYIGITKDYETIDNVFIGNSAYYGALQNGKTATFSPTNTSENIYKISADGLYNNTSAFVYPMRLYNRESPLYEQKWLLCGIIENSSLYSSTAKLHGILLFALIVSLIGSLIGALIITQKYIAPIKTLMLGIPKLSPSCNCLPRTGITEFDKLAEAIEKQNVSIYKAGNRVSDIIDMTHISLGVFEYKASSDKFYCTHKVFEILDISDEGWEHNYIDHDTLISRLKSIDPSFSKSADAPDTYLYKTMNGIQKWLDIKQITNDGSTLLAISDITDNVLEKEKIIHDRDYDVLTGLLNRRGFARKMRYLVDNGNCTNGILSIWDLDNLKYTNDSYGHEIGDKYICMVAEALARSLPENSISARLSGDEFTVFIYNEPMDKMESFLRKLHNTLMHEALVLPDGSKLNASASAGFAFYDEHASTFSELLKYADFAMYQVKKSSKGNIRLYDKESYVKNYILVQGVGELDRIIMEEAIHYAYQPIVYMQSKHTFAYEALIRPISDLLGRPDNLLRVAENQSKLGQIEKITWFHALKQFFNQLRPNDTAKIFINSIPNQILSDNDIEELERIYGDRLGRVVMEITESTKSEDSADDKKRIFCAKWGIAIALDDYGAGYSNNDMLVTRKFNFIKLDRSLVQNIHLSQSTQNLVSGVISYCHDNGVRVIAEGIETQDEYNTLLEMGADFGQGYYFARPRFNLYED